MGDCNVESVEKDEKGYIWLLTLQLFFSREYEGEGVSSLYLYCFMLVKLYMYMYIHRKMYETVAQLSLGSGNFRWFLLFFIYLLFIIKKILPYCSLYCLKFL